MKKIFAYSSNVIKVFVCIVLFSFTAYAVDIQTDIVIVGAGGAGLSAALSASQGGAKVMLLEKDVTVGGTGNFAEGIFGVETAMQRELWIDLTKDKVFMDEMTEMHWGTNAALVRNFHNHSAATIEWLISQGVKFEGPSHNFYGNNKTWHLIDGLGAGLIKALNEKVVKDKNITLMLETPGRELIIKNGRVAGVKAENEDGEYNIYAKGGVIIATGGYANNIEMVKKYTGLKNPVNIANLKKTGDGIKMAIDAGATTEGLGIVQTIAGKDVPNGGRVDVPLSMLANQPRNIWVNADGDRFCNEWISFDFVSASNSIKREKAVWAIFDTNIRKYYMTEGTDAGIGVIGKAMTKMANFDEIWSTAEKTNDPYIIKGSLKDISKKTGIPYENLKKTVDEYNKNSARNIDPNFAKDRQWLHTLDTSKPLYAIKMKEIILTTLGGIRVNKNLQALNEELEPIEGLYVAGNDAGGLFLGSYSLNSASGTTYGFAVNSGRIAAQDILAKMGKGKK